MKARTLAAFLLLASAALLPETGLPQALSPHAEPDGCHVCHIAIPSPEDAAVARYFLVRDTIDDVCRACHDERGCSMGANRTFHASGVDAWSLEAENRPHPRTLPLFNGKIACTTCHHRTQPEEGSFRMIRKSAWRDGQPDLSAFCADCHGGR